MTGLVLPLHELDRTMTTVVGGKAASLGELSRLDGVRVPAGWCVTTAAYRRALTAAPAPVHALLERAATLDPQDTDAVRDTAAGLRSAVAACPVPADVADAIGAAVAALGPDAALAVRSSATTEDGTTTSAAGQHDSFPGVRGVAAVLEHVRRCWASLFTERALGHRLRGGPDEPPAMAVVVQRMVVPVASGVLFTADPGNGDRRTTVVEAVPGSGATLMAGGVTPERWRVRDDRVVADALAPTTRGTLTDAQVHELATLGRRVADHLGDPQDVEWCRTEDGFWLVQSRPITTLFPVPTVEGDGPRVFLSVGHQQMMTDAMTPLGLSVWQRTSPAPMHVAGSRLFVDATRVLAHPDTRDGFLAMAATTDPLTADALRTVVERGDLLPAPTGEAPPPPPGSRPEPIDVAPDVVPRLIARAEASIAGLAARLDGLTGPALLDAVIDDLAGLRGILFAPDSHQAVMAGMQAAAWLNEHLGAWLGEANPADALARSAPHNVTAEMGLALLDVADHVRPHPEVVAFLEGATDPGWLDGLAEVPGGTDAAAAIRGFLDRYGARCAGEIDLGRPRWHERPATLLPTILADVRSFGPGAAATRFEEGRRYAAQRRSELLARLRALPDGQDMAARTDAMIDQLRAFIGYREFPKFAMVRRYDLIRRALLAEAGRLVAAGVLRAVDDVHQLTLDELRDVVASRHVDHELVARRRRTLATDRRRTPPRVLTSDGEVFHGSYHRGDVPTGALVGLGVSAGVVEGRARVLTDMADAELRPGDVLVTRFTDPSWTPAFVAITGLVTEVGGLMTHGAVIAREYGLPAVVAVDHATELIRDGQRIRVDGTAGHVVVLDD